VRGAFGGGVGLLVVELGVGMAGIELIAGAVVVVKVEVGGSDCSTRGSLMCNSSICASCCEIPFCVSTSVWYSFSISIDCVCAGISIPLIDSSFAISSSCRVSSSRYRFPSSSSYNSPSVNNFSVRHGLDRVESVERFEENASPIGETGRLTTCMCSSSDSASFDAVLDRPISNPVSFEKPLTDTGGYWANNAEEIQSLLARTRVLSAGQ
jgi:hypothetical protein